MLGQDDDDWMASPLVAPANRSCLKMAKFYAIIRPYNKVVSQKGEKELFVRMLTCSRSLVRVVWEGLNGVAESH